MVIRLAFRFILSVGWVRYWRIWAMTVLMAVATTLALSGASLIHLRLAEVQRDAQRRIIPALETPRATDLLMLGYFDTIDGRQLQSYYIEPAQPGVDPVLPPGLGTLPDPGTAVVSPALFGYLMDHPRVRATFPELQVLRPDGTQTGGEWLLYRRADMPAAAFPDAVTIRATAFGESGFPLSPFGGVMTLPEMIAGVSALAFVPAVLLAVIVTKLGHAMRRGRSALLFALGAARLSLVRLSALEQCLLAIPGAGVGVVLWWVFVRSRTLLPLVDYPVVADDLAVPGPWLVLGITAVLGVAVGSDGVATIAAYGASYRVEATSERHAMRIWRLAPVGLLTFGIVARVWIGGERGEALFFVVFAVSVLITPILLPMLVAPLGSLLATSRFVTVYLAGRLLSWDAVRVARPVGLLSALLAIAVAVVGYLALNRAFYAYPEEGPDEVVRLSYLDPRAHHLDALRRALDTTLVVPVNRSNGTLAVAADCRAIERFNPALQCGPAVSVTDAAHPSVPTLVAQLFPEMRMLPEFGAATATETYTDVLIFGASEEDDLLDTVAGVARATVTRPQMIGAATLRQEPPARLDWLLGGLWGAVATLGVGVTVMLVDGFLEFRLRRRALVWMGQSDKQLATMEAWQFIVVYLLAATLGLTIGIVGMTQGLAARRNVETPWVYVSMIGLVVLVVGGVAALVVWRAARRDPSVSRKGFAS